MNTDSKLLNKSKEYITNKLKELPKDYCYHNLEHTEEVVKAAKEISAACNLSDKETLLVSIAAWFHDLGYLKNALNHEQESIKLMRSKLNEWNIDHDDIERIANIIEATQMPQSPKDKLSMVLCDADLYHLSTTLFKKRTEGLRKELVNTHDKSISPTDWHKMSLEFVKSHTYFTDYGKQVLEPKKKKNLEWLATNCTANVNEEIKEEDKKSGKKDKKAKKPERGIETMFRITSKNHLTLSGMADNKANIMISINSIILSVLVSLLFRKLEDYPNLIIPGMILVVVCLTTIVFAVLATRPNISSGTFTREDIEQRKTNLLFFGNFHNMELDNYMWGMQEMMKDSEFLYGSMIKDIYFLGIVLGKKYKMLRKSYNVFMFGFIISIMAFVIAMVFFPAPRH